VAVLEGRPGRGRGDEPVRPSARPRRGRPSLAAAVCNGVAARR